MVSHTQLGFDRPRYCTCCSKINELKMGPRYALGLLNEQYYLSTTSHFEEVIDDDDL